MNKNVFGGLVVVALVIAIIASSVLTLDMLAINDVRTDHTPYQAVEYISEQGKTTEQVMTICVMPLKCS